MHSIKLENLHCVSQIVSLQSPAEVWDSSTSERYAQLLADLLNVIEAEGFDQHERQSAVPLEQRQLDFANQQTWKKYQQVIASSHGGTSSDAYIPTSRPN